MESFLKITKALSDEHRLRVLMLLQEQELCACQIVDSFDLAGSTMSKHLSVLKDAKLINSRKDGRWIYYRLSDKTEDQAVISAINFAQNLLKDSDIVRQDKKNLEKVLSFPMELCNPKDNKYGFNADFKAKNKILFLCVANSARSQMAEGLAKNILGKEYVVRSAGSSPSYVNPFAVKVMSEVDIDISGNASKSLFNINPETVDIVVTLCPEEVLPIFWGKVFKLDWPLIDPANPNLSDEDQLKLFRLVREEIKRRLGILKTVLEKYDFAKPENLDGLFADESEKLSLLNVGCKPELWQPK